MALRAYEEIAPEPLAFPIGGKVYVVGSPGYKTGLKLQELVSGEMDAEAEFGDDPEGLFRLILGPVFDQMKTDNVPGEALARAAFTCLTDYKFGRAAAEQVWESGIDPKALAQKMQEMAAERQSSTAPRAKATTRSRSTASASRTRKPASTRSTTSRKR